MKPTFITVRAIGAEFARRTPRPLLIIGAVIAMLLLGVGGWLAAQSALWWLLEAIFLIGAIIFVVLIVAAFTLIRIADPPQNNDQKLAVGSFVDKLQHVADNVRTPQFIILYRVVRDTFRPRQNGFIETLSRDSKTLATNLLSLAVYLGLLVFFFLAVTSQCWFTELRGA